jgi:hypothetical protein
LIDDTNLKSLSETDENSSENDSEESLNYEIEKSNKDVSVNTIELPISSNKDLFTVMIVGPGMNTKIEINEEDDLIILDAMIKKIKRKLSEGSE